LHHDATWYGGRPQPRGLCVRWGLGTQSPSLKRKRSPQFSAHVYCGQTAAWIKMSLGIEIGLGPDNIVLDRDPAPPPEKGAEPPPKFSAHVYCGQMAGWMKMPLGTKVDLSPGHTVLDGVPAPRERGHSSPPSFRSMSIVATVAHLSYC